MGLFTKTKGEGWSLDRKTGILTIDGDLGNNLWPFKKIANKVWSVEAEKGAKAKYCNGLFKDMKSLEIADLKNLDVSECEDAALMFKGCSSLLSLDLSGWNTARMTDITAMFKDCTKLMELNLSGWNTGSVSSMDFLFDGCRFLKELDLSGWHLEISGGLFVFTGASETVNLKADDDKLRQKLQEREDLSDKSWKDLYRVMEETFVTNNEKSAEINFALGGSLASSVRKPEVAAAEKPAVTAAPEKKETVQAKKEPVQTQTKPIQEKKEPVPEPVIGQGWSFDRTSGVLTISGDLGEVKYPFAGIAKEVRSVVAKGEAAVKYGSGLFRNMENLVSAGLYWLDVSKCEDMSEMFLGCSSLTALDLSFWHTEHLKNTSYMFMYCSKLESITTNYNWNFSWVNDAQYMFAYCYALRELDLEYWDDGWIFECKGMFKECRSLEKLDLRPFAMEDGFDYSEMFAGCANLRTLRLSGWDTWAARDLNSMFAGCKSLETLDLTGWHFCLWDLDTGLLDEDADIDRMFEGVPRTVRVYANDDTVIRLLPQGVKVEPCSWHLDADTLTLVIDGELPDWSAPDWNGPVIPPWYNYRTAVLHIEARPGAKTLTCSRMFKQCVQLKSVDLKALDTSEVTDMEEMFRECEELEQIDLSGLDVSKALSIRSMFAGCKALKKADLSGWNDASIINIDNLFENCGALETVKMTGWEFDMNTGVLTISGDLGNQEYPFSWVSPMVRSIVTEKGACIRDGRGLFMNMKSLVSADLSQLDVSECTDMSYMFSECEALETVKAGALWKPVKVKDMTRMFNNCSALKELDIPSWQTDSLQKCEGMFVFCFGLEELDLRSMHMGKAADISNMFAFCSALWRLDLSGWDTWNVKNMQGLFTCCDYLLQIDLTGWHVNKDTDTTDAFDSVSEDVHVLADDESVGRLVPKEIRLEFVPYQDDRSAEELIRLGDEEWAKDSTELTMALRYYKAAAEKGNYQGAWRIARIYKNGWGVPADQDQYVQWMKTAAEHDDPSGLNALAFLYVDGDGVEQDYDKAFDLLKRSADKGNMSAVNNLGWMYEQGYGSPQDYEMAFRLYSKAAKAGNKASMLHLGDLYRDGKGVKKDRNTALKWYEEAQKAGNKQAAERIKALKAE